MDSEMLMRARMQAMIQQLLTNNEQLRQKNWVLSSDNQRLAVHHGTFVRQIGAWRDELNRRAAQLRAEVNDPGARMTARPGPSYDVTGGPLLNLQPATDPSAPQTQHLSGFRGDGQPAQWSQLGGSVRRLRPYDSGWDDFDE